jgi:hypothetical protein
MERVKCLARKFVKKICSARNLVCYDRGQRLGSRTEQVFQASIYYQAERRSATLIADDLACVAGLPPSAGLRCAARLRESLCPQVPQVQCAW